MDVDVGDLDGGVVADGELVVSGGEGAVLFVPVDAALDGMPLLVVVSVERRWPTSGRALRAAVGQLVGFVRNGRRDAASAQVGAVAAAGVGPIGQHPVRPGPWPTGSRPSRYPDTAEDHGELRAVGGLPGREHGGQRLAAG